MFILSKDEINFQDCNIYVQDSQKIAKNARLIVPMIENKEATEREAYFKDLANFIDDYKIEIIPQGLITNSLIERYVELGQRLGKCDTLELIDLSNKDVVKEESTILSYCKKFRIHSNDYFELRLEDFNQGKSPIDIGALQFKKSFSSTQLSMICHLQETKINSIESMLAYHSKFGPDYSIFLDDQFKIDIPNPPVLDQKTRYAKIAKTNIDNNYIYYIMPIDCNIIQEIYYWPNRRVEFFESFSF